MRASAAAVSASRASRARSSVARAAWARCSAMAAPPAGRLLQGVCQVLTNYKCGPIGYICPAGNTELGHLVATEMRGHGGRQGAIDRWRGFGVRLGYLLISQAAWKTDHFFRKIPRFRAFSLGSTQCMIRCAMHLWLYERKKGRKKRRGRARRMASNASRRVVGQWSGAGGAICEDHIAFCGELLGV